MEAENREAILLDYNSQIQQVLIALPEELNVEYPLPESRTNGMHKFPQNLGKTYHPRILPPFNLRPQILGITSIDGTSDTRVKSKSKFSTLPVL